MCPYFCKNVSVVMYRKFGNVPILKDYVFISGNRILYLPFNAFKNVRGWAEKFIG